jgi:DNA-binding transcriptional regulator WhiA
MSELAALHDPPITKSGVSHRLKKLVDISETPLNNKSK